MTEKEIAQALLPLVGGKENIVSVMHCATRLRIVVTDKEKIQVKEVENLDKVKGSFFNAGQYQIIFGTGLVNRVYEAVMNELGLQPEAAIDDKSAKPVTGNRFQRAIRMFSDVFVPIIPVLVATGLFMGLRGLLTQDAVLGIFGMTSDDIPQQLLLFTEILTDTAFSFLPALVCWSTFKNFGGSPVIGIVLGLMLVSNSLPSAYDVGSGAAEPLIFFGFIPVAGYQGSVLPAFATGVLAAKFEKFLRKHVPDAIDLIVTPLPDAAGGYPAGHVRSGPHPAHGGKWRPFCGGRSAHPAYGHRRSDLRQLWSAAGHLRYPSHPQLSGDQYAGAGWLELPQPHRYLRQCGPGRRCARSSHQGGFRQNQTDCLSLLPVRPAGHHRTCGLRCQPAFC